MMSGSDVSRIFTVSQRETSLGERAALHGLVSDLRPDLAIGIGTAEGGGLTTLADHAEEVHSVGRSCPTQQVADLAHVHVHIGDSDGLLLELLRDLEGRGRHVDVVVLDGGSRGERVRHYIETLLESSACLRTVIVVHHAAVPEVRRGLEAVGLEQHGKVGFVDLDFIAGILDRDRSPGQVRGGLALVLLGDVGLTPDETHHPAYDVLGAARSRWYGESALVDRVARLDTSLLGHVNSETTSDDRASLLAVHAAAVEALGYFNYLEVGSHLGGSLQALLVDPRCTTVTSVDPRPASQPEDGAEDAHYPRNSTARMREVLSAVSGSDLSKLTTIDSSVEDIDPTTIGRPDVCFVDGEHTARAVAIDAAFCARVLRGAGLIVFHDYSVVGPAIGDWVASLEQPYRVYGLQGDIAVVELGASRLLDQPVLRARLAPFDRGSSSTSLAD